MNNSNNSDNKIAKLPTKFKISLQNNNQEFQSYVISTQNTTQKENVQNQVYHLKGLQKMYSKIFRKEKIWEIMENTMKIDTLPRNNQQLTAIQKHNMQNIYNSLDKTQRDFESCYAYGTFDQMQKNYSENQIWNLEKHVIEGEEMFSITLDQKQENYQKLDKYYLQASKQYNKDKRYFSSSYVSCSKNNNQTYWKLEQEWENQNPSIPYVGRITVGYCKDRSLIGQNLQLHGYYKPLEMTDKFDSDNQKLNNQRVVDFKNRNQIFLSISKQESHNQIWAICQQY